jgi:ATP-dependent DNA helicase RecG
VTTVLDEPLGKGVVGRPTAAALEAAFGMQTVGDLLRHYPRRYLHRGELTDLASLPDDENVTVLARVRSIKSRALPTLEGSKRRRSIVEAVITDGSGQLALTWFNQAWRVKEMPPGTEGMFSGTVGVFNRKRQLTHPEFIPLAKVDDADARTRRPIVVYPATKEVDTETIRKALEPILDTLGELPDPVPEAVRERHGLIGLRTAILAVHRPEDDDAWRAAQKRLRWDEAFVLQAVLAQRRIAARGVPATPRRHVPGGLLDSFEARLPFTLTAGQTSVGKVIAADIAQQHPMQRLLQGEVGSGKTVVALRAMLTVVDSGGQAALLAPTEVLAQQHHRSISAILGPLAEGGMLGGADVATRVALLTGSQPTAVRRRALLEVASGDAGIVVGTHALLQENVDFFDLGLVVVDEQHRFGVEQRDLLRAKGATPPHLLVMTATPIPRTVAMTVFGDLETSTLVEIPAGRPGVVTHVVPAGELPHYLDRAWQRVREEVAAGHQAFVVCPRIGEAEGAEDDAGWSAPEPAPGAVDDSGPVRAALAVLDVGPALAAGPLVDMRVDVLHGRMPADAKDDTMRRFAAGEIDVLVATTVIEVGVDVPNATAMVIMDADRFGMSALHQLRGRVGRGSAPGLCLLVTEVSADSAGGERLTAVARTTDGFELSRLDLEQRREGDVLGASQSGRRSSLRLLRVIRDEDIIVAAREEAVRLVEDDPQLAAHPALAAAVEGVLAAERAEFLERS